MCFMNLETYLSSTGMTQQIFAEKLGVKQSAISQWISGKRTPKRQMLPKIIEATDGKVTPNDFFGGDNAMQ